MKTLAITALAAIALTFIAPTADAHVAAPTWVAANSVSTGDQDNASVAINRNGYVAVAWEDDRDTDNATDNVHSDIWVRLFHNGAAVYEK
jgi:uncharacterized protein YndB with AHSA1/START domain